MKDKDYNQRLKALKQQIHEAFADVPYPGDDNIYAYNTKCDVDGDSGYIGK